jgi:heat shock protein HslJ
LKSTVNILTAVALAAFGLTACALTPEEADKQAERVYGQTWIAEEVAGRPVANGVEPSLVFNPDGKVTGHAGCNGYFGSVIIDGEAMSFGNLGATRKLCPEPAMTQEGQLLQALDSTRGYRLEKDGLELLDGAGATLVRFRTETGA